MNTCEKMFQRSLRVTPGGVHSPVRALNGIRDYPVFFESAQGAFLTSVEGDKYIDFCQSFGPNILGHRDQDVTLALKEILEKVWTLGACEPYSLELAEFITEGLPWVEKVRFVSSGTEAVMSVLRLARAVTGRDKILKFEGCYHGHVDQMLVKAGSGLAGTSASSSAGVSEIMCKDTLVAQLDDMESIKRIFHQNKDQVAAVIIEPLPANFGLLEQRREFLLELVDVARKNKSLVIFDEVISGFRVSLGGMAEKLNIQPDLVTYGKVLGGGLPVGAYGGRSEFMDLIAPSGGVYQAGTLSAHPMAMVAGLATLKKLEKLNGIPLLKQQTDWFCKNLNKQFSEQDIPLKVVSYESLFWIHSYTEKQIRNPAQIPPNQNEMYQRAFSRALTQGLYLPPNAYEVYFMSLAHSKEILNQALGKFVKAFGMGEITDGQ